MSAPSDGGASNVFCDSGANGPSSMKNVKKRSQQVDLPGQRRRGKQGNVVVTLSSRYADSPVLSSIIPAGVCSPFTDLWGQGTRGFPVPGAVSGSSLLLRGQCDERDVEQETGWTNTQHLDANSTTCLYMEVDEIDVGEVSGVFCLASTDLNDQGARGLAVPGIESGFSVMEEQFDELDVEQEAIEEISQHLDANSTTRLNKEVDEIDVDGESDVLYDNEDDDDSVVDEELTSSSTVREIVDLITRLAPEVYVTREEVRSIVEQARLSVSDEYGIQEAKEAFGDFIFPADIAERDTKRFLEAGGSIEAMTEQRHTDMLPDRLNLERIEKTLTPGIHDPIDVERLRDLVAGMLVFIDDDIGSVTYFQPNSIPAALRSLYLEVQGAVNTAVDKLHKQDLIFILPQSLALSIPDIHWTPIHWTTKKGKRIGRIIFDAKDCKHGSSLNSEKAKDKIKDCWGFIHHPTIEKIILRVLGVIDLFGWDDVTLVKADVTNAFMQLFFRPECVHLMASILTDGLAVIYHCGQFGWCGTPYAFDVVTRILRKEIQYRIAEYGAVDMFVDDIVGAVKSSRLAEGLGVFAEVTDNLGVNLAEDKYEHGRVLEMIGYEIDLIQRLMTLSKRNFWRVLLGFMSVDVTQPISIKKLERLCSWSARYTIVIRVLKPLTNILYSQKRGMTNRNATVSLTPRGRVAVKIWCCTLVLLKLSERTFARSLDSFRISMPSWCIEYDSSLKGLGVLVWDQRHFIDGGSEDLSGVVSVTSMYPLPFDLGTDSSYQNVVEFIAVILGLCMLKRRGISNVTIKLKGDSRSSLKWGSSELFKGTLVQRASVVFMLAAVHLNVVVGENEHVAGKLHVTCDKLSRGVTPKVLGFSDDVIYHVSDDPLVSALIAACNPIAYSKINNEDDLIDLWVAVRNLLMGL